MTPRNKNLQWDFGRRKINFIFRICLFRESWLWIFVCFSYLLGYFHDFFRIESTALNKIGSDWKYFSTFQCCDGQSKKLNCSPDGFSLTLSKSADLGLWDPRFRDLKSIALLSIRRGFRRPWTHFYKVKQFCRWTFCLKYLFLGLFINFILTYLKIEKIVSKDFFLFWCLFVSFRKLEAFFASTSTSKCSKEKQTIIFEPKSLSQVAE